MASPLYLGSDSTHHPLLSHYYPSGVSDQPDSPPTIGIQVTECEALPPLDNEDASPGSGPGSFPPTPPNMPNSIGTTGRSNRFLQISTSPFSLEVPSKQYHSAPTSPTELLFENVPGSQDPSKDTAVGRRRAHSHSGTQLPADHVTFSSSPSAPPHSPFPSPQSQDQNWRSTGSPYSDTTSLDQSPYIDDVHDFDHLPPDSNGSPLLPRGRPPLYQHSNNQSTDFLPGHSNGTSLHSADHSLFYEQHFGNQSSEILDALNEFPFFNESQPSSQGSGFSVDWIEPPSLLLDFTYQDVPTISSLLHDSPALTSGPQINSMSMNSTETADTNHAGSVFSPNLYQLSSSGLPSLPPGFSGHGFNNEYSQNLPQSLDASRLGDSSTNNGDGFPPPIRPRLSISKSHVRGPRSKPTHRRPPDEEVIARKQLVYDALVHSNDIEEARARVEELVEKHRDEAYLDDFRHAISHHPKESDTGRERARCRRRREPTFKCILCEDLMTTNNNLQNHYRSHLSMSVYKCSFCSKRFMTDSIYQRHLKTTAKCPGSAKYAASKAQNSPLDDFSQGNIASGSLAQIR
ncbi:hypothetical protein CPB83DRAFT_406219 [Crepidotus variabilis]|uniref:C2H2-type domain-containing protein n=1 Tax=Crepidotus variabilis TaxID=179855 RepID=A0A9P6EQW5_9AGAR|nr:hypothetical protein CPB83DRAFT_406219 [Crepidotus variabilis]